MKKRCLVLFALPEEMIPVAVKNMEVVSECIGVGKVDAALSALEAIEKHTPDLVVSMGTAGSVRCRVGDVVLCSEFVDRDLEKTGLSMLTCRMRTFGGEDVAAFGFSPSLDFSGVCNTGDSFVTEAPASDGDVFDMEAFAVAKACKKRNLPFFAVKYVTDIIGSNSVKAWADKLADAHKGLSDFVKGNL